MYNLYASSDCSGTAAYTVELYGSSSPGACNAVGGDMSYRISDRCTVCTGGGAIDGSTKARAAAALAMAAVVLAVL